MAKRCGGCGKFMNTGESIRCSKCSEVYHRDCVGIPAEVAVSRAWLCPGCKVKIPRADNSTTPVKAASSDYCTSVSIVTEPDPALSPSVGLDVAKEIRCLREELGAMRNEIREYRNELLSLRTDVTSCNERVNNIETKVGKLEKRFEEQNPAQYDQLEETISDLKKQLNDRDQDLLLNDIMITGIPESKEESPTHIFKLVSIKLGIEIDDRDIVYADRIGLIRRNLVENGGVIEPVRPRSIAVRLARRATRDLLLRAARVRRGLTITDLGLPEQRGRTGGGGGGRFYVNERLTRINGTLFSSAREAGQRRKYKYIWTKEGRIYVRKEDGAPAQRIRCNEDISRIFGNGSV